MSKQNKSFFLVRWFKRCVLGSREELSGADALCDTARQVTQACLRVIEEI